MYPVDQFFLVNDAVSFVDLPGYGYARVSKKIRAGWQPMVETYLTHRSNLLGLILIIDIRRDPKEEEHKLARWLISHDMPYLVVLTKADKLSKTQQLKRAAVISSQMNRSAGEVILFSAKTRAGRETVLEEITNLISWHEQNKEETD